MENEHRKEKMSSQKRQSERQKLVLLIEEPLKKKELEKKITRRSNLKKPDVEKNNSKRENVQQAHRKKKELTSKKNQSLKKSKKRAQTDQRSGEKFECGYCRRKFQTLESRNNHERIHTNEKPFECDLCHKFYNNLVSIAVHMRVHTGEKPYICKFNKCDKKFRLHAQLIHHTKANVDGTIRKKPEIQRGNRIIKDIRLEDMSAFRLFECYLCSFRGHVNDVRIHIKEEHVGAKVHKCKICSKKLAYSSIEAHMKNHSNNDRFKCKFCGKIFKRKDGLNVHLQFHTREFTHECKYCHKKFPSIYALKNHVRTHTGLKPHVCDYCKKGFVKRSDLIRHNRTHTGERPFKCNLCRMTYTRNHLLTDHKRIKHKIKDSNILKKKVSFPLLLTRLKENKFSFNFFFMEISINNCQQI